MKLWRGERAQPGTLQASRRLVWLLVLPVLVLLAVLTLLQYRQRLGEAERELLRRADERAQELEAIARPAMDHVQDLRRMLEQRWSDMPDGGPVLRGALTQRHLAGAVDGWSMDAAPEALRERFGQVWWAPADGSAPDAMWLRRAQAFVEAARVVHQRAPGFEATWFAAGELNASFGYPWVSTESMLATMGVPTLRGVDAPRLAGTERALRSLARDPADLSFWGPPYVSQLNGELVQSHGAMVLVDGKYRGEVSLDFRLDALQRIVNAWQSGPERVWVVDRQSLHVLADARLPLAAPPGTGLADTRVQVALASRLPQGLTEGDLNAALAARDSLRHGGDWALAAAVRTGSPWLYVHAVPHAALRAAVLPTLLPNAVLGLALLAMFVAGHWLIERWFVAPSLRVLAYLRQLSTDAQAPVPQLGARWNGWVDEVTDTFRVQRELQRRDRAHEAFKSAMVDHAPTAIVTAGGDGRIVDFNPAAERMFGVPRAGALGRVLGDVLIPEPQRATYLAEMRLLRQGQRGGGLDGALELRGLRADGTEFPMQMLAFHLESEGESFTTAFVTDLSARQDAARQIERQREALRQSEKLSAMGMLLAGVAHEINNPLAIVMGRASLIEEKAEGSLLAADAQRIREAAERCGRIVRTFLNMARQRPPERHAVQLNDIARATADLLGYTLRSHGIAVELALVDELPVVQADADQLGQVLLNLVVNAQQALVADTQPVRSGADAGRCIVLSSGMEPTREGRVPRVWLRVADNGPGVPKAARAHLFEPFFTTKALGLGTGLGLSVSRAIVREHGGELLLEPGERGAQFRLSLPTSGAPEATLLPQASPCVTPERTWRVLVVDDEPEVADLMRAVLEGAGHEVATAESGAVALEMLAEARFDAIVSDVRMPDTDGAALWRAVREREPALASHMLFVSGDTLSPHARMVLDESGCAGLDKPFSNADLLAALRAVVAR